MWKTFTLESFFAAADGVSPNLERDLRGELEAAAIIAACDVSSGEGVIVFGRVAGRSFAGRTLPPELRAVGIEFDYLQPNGQPTGEFERLLRLVIAVRGRHEYPLCNHPVCFKWPLPEGIQ